MLAPHTKVLAVACAATFLFARLCFAQSNVYSFSVHTHWTVGSYPLQFGLEGYSKNPDGSFAIVGPLSSGNGPLKEHTYVILGPKAFSVPLRPLPVALLGIVLMLSILWLAGNVCVRHYRRAHEAAKS